MRIKFGIVSKGFTLIEVIVSTVILSLVIVAFINLFPVSSAINARANRMSQAAILAEELIELFRASPFDTLKDFIAAGNDTGTHQIDADGITGGWQYTRSWALIDSGNIIYADISLSWPTPRGFGTSSTRIVTQISNHD